jgi:hypothetical protein
MKKSALLLFAAIVMINAVIAQQIEFKREVNTNNLKAQNKLSNSGYKMKLDSVVISTRSYRFIEKTQLVKTGKLVIE